MSNYYGKWSVNDIIFDKRKEAALYASKNGCPDIEYIWHNDIWNKFNRSLLGKVSLIELYRQRAQQLRDSYDYLILSYSGGSDSHNILMTFINNNIKLDQIFIHLPFNLINSSLHKPNMTDQTARNLISEWDYVIKPMLHQLTKTNPEIIIEFSDWTNNILDSVLKKDISSDLIDLWGLGNLGRNLDFSKIGLSELDKGRTVATIFGAEKPIIINNDHKVYMLFSDRPVMAHKNNNFPVEFFYWTPNMPELAYEMAYQVYLYFKFNIHLQKFMWNLNMNLDFDTILSVNDSIAKHVCYSSTWDFNKFQVEKPKQGGIGKDLHWYLYELPEFQRAKESWQYHYTDYFKDIDKKYLGDDNQFKRFVTTGFYIGEL